MHLKCVIVEGRVPLLYGFSALTFSEDIFVLNSMLCLILYVSNTFTDSLSHQREVFFLFTKPEIVNYFWHSFAYELC